MAQAQPDSAPKVRTYYIAADEVDWDYAPGGVNKMMGMKFEGYSKVFTERGPHRIGTVYRKALYREYTDETFTQLKPRPAEWEHTGILGPILRAEVGDTFASSSRTMPPAPTACTLMASSTTKTPRARHTTTAHPARTKKTTPSRPARHTSTPGKCRSAPGPGPNDPSSIVWLYHSHTNELKDVESGLIGAMIVTRRGMADADGKPKDVDREFVCLFLLLTRT